MVRDTPRTPIKGGLQVYVRAIPANGVSNIDVRGNFIRIADARGVLQIIARKTDLEGSDGVEFSLNMATQERWYSTIEFTSLSITNNTDAAQTVHIMAGFGDFTGNDVARGWPAPFVQTSAIETVDSDIIEDGDFVEIPIVGADSSRKRVFIGGEFASTGDDGPLEIRIGPAGVVGLENVELLANWGEGGVNLTGGLETTAAISAYIINRNGAEASATITRDIQVVEERY